MTRPDKQLREVRAEVEAVYATLAHGRNVRHEQAERDALIVDQAVGRALSGTHEVFVHEDRFPDLPGGMEMPDEWASVPFARFAMFEDSGDRSVGIPSRNYWALAENQQGTALHQMAGEMMAMHAKLQEVARVLRSTTVTTLTSFELQRTAEDIEALLDTTSLQGVSNQETEHQSH